MIFVAISNSEASIQCLVHRSNFNTLKIQTPVTVSLDLLLLSYVTTQHSHAMIVKDERLT